MHTDNIVAAWIQVETAIPGRTLSDAVHELVEDTGVPVRQNRVNEWRDGQRTPPPAALRYMARVIAQWVLEQEGIQTLALSDDALDRIADRMTPPLCIAR